MLGDKLLDGGLVQGRFRGRLRRRRLLRPGDAHQSAGREQDWQPKAGRDPRTAHGSRLLAPDARASRLSGERANATSRGACATVVGALSSVRPARFVVKAILRAAEVWRLPPSISSNPFDPAAIPHDHSVAGDRGRSAVAGLRGDGRGHAAARMTLLPPPHWEGDPDGVIRSIFKFLPPRPPSSHSRRRAS